MHYQGIVPGRPFPINRPLTEQDRKYHLRQGVRLGEVTPYPDLMVIKLNSTYLEVVDKYYGWKGWVAFVIGAMALMMLGLVALNVVYAIGVFSNNSMDRFYMHLFLVFFLLILAGIGLFLGRFEWAYYTHYPMRLNRNTQMVHVFRKNGTVLSVPWNEVFFTLDQDAGAWEIRGHVMEAGSDIVKETFVLGSNDANNAEGMRKLKSHWEFFRRYMAEGPEAVAKYVKWAMPVDGKRESFRVGYEVLASNFRHPNPLVAALALLAWPIIGFSSLGRWVAMRKSKIPRWPEEIEAVIVVAADDPYHIDARINPPEFR